MTRIVFLLAFFSGRGGRTPQAVRKTKYDPTKPFSCPQCQRRYNHLIHTKKLDKRCALKQKYSRGTLIHKIRFQRKSK